MDSAAMTPRETANFAAAVMKTARKTIRSTNAASIAMRSVRGGNSVVTIRGATGKPNDRTLSVANSSNSVELTKAIAAISSSC